MTPSRTNTHVLVHGAMESRLARPTTSRQAPLAAVPPDRSRRVPACGQPLTVHVFDPGSVLKSPVTTTGTRCSAATAAPPAAWCPLPLPFRPAPLLALPLPPALLLPLPPLPPACAALPAPPFPPAATDAS